MLVVVLQYEHSFIDLLAFYGSICMRIGANRHVYGSSGQEDLRPTRGTKFGFL